MKKYVHNSLSKAHNAYNIRQLFKLHSRSPDVVKMKMDMNS